MYGIDYILRQSQASKTLHVSACKVVTCHIACVSQNLMGMCLIQYGIVFDFSGHEDVYVSVASYLLHLKVFPSSI